MLKQSERLSEPAIYKRKGIWMVEYLRERRVVSRGPHNLREVSMRMKKFFRRKHFEERQASHGE